MQSFDGGLHVGHSGGHQRRKADQLGPGLAHGFDNALGRYIAAKVEHIVAVVFENDAHDIFADIMYIPLDGGDNDLALAALCLAGSGDLCLDGFKGGLGSGGGLQQLRQKNGAFFKAIAHHVQRRDQRGVDNVQRVTHRQGGFGGGAGLGL